MDYHNPSTILYLGLGSNLGQKEQAIQQAIKTLGAAAGMQCVKCSRFYVTEPEGFSSPNLFVNAAAKFRTTLSPEKVLELTQNVEKALGRKSKSVDHEYCDRPIDIDILFYGRKILQTARLAVPHPLLIQRLFVLEPLAEIAPCFVHPQKHKTILHLLQDLKNDHPGSV